MQGTGIPALTLPLSLSGPASQEMPIEKELGESQASEGTPEPWAQLKLVPVLTDFTAARFLYL